MIKKRKADIILVLFILLSVIILWLIIEFVVKKSGNDNQVLIKSDGEVICQLPLNVNKSVTVEGYKGGYNVVVIEDGKVSMYEADCPDKLCVKTGNISKTGETIVCLPHRIVVEIKGNDREVDDIVQ
ncbi:MAG: NusG domain II-containing protein [Eubacteriales bacterium]|nr:NusG domain II-containing protein [Eubacteriales bacterium]